MSSIFSDMAEAKQIAEARGELDYFNGWKQSRCPYSNRLLAKYWDCGWHKARDVDFAARGINA